MSVPMREWNKNALANMKGDLMDNVKPKESGMLPKLAKAAQLGFLNDPEMQAIEAMTSERDRMDKIISILSGKGDECFSKFCDILTNSSNEVWADSLRAKAEEFKGGSDSPQGAAGGSAANDILSKKVYEHKEYLSLMRMNVSRAAGTQGRAVLGELGLKQATIASCFQNNPLNYEEAVQSGLVQWSGGHANKSPTWSVLLQAMEVAGIDEEYTKNLKRSLGLSE